MSSHRIHGRARKFQVQMATVEVTVGFPCDHQVKASEDKQNWPTSTIDLDPDRPCTTTDWQTIDKKKADEINETTRLNYLNKEKQMRAGPSESYDGETANSTSCQRGAIMVRKSSLRTPKKERKQRRRRHHSYSSCPPSLSGASTIPGDHRNQSSRKGTTTETSAAMSSLQATTPPLSHSNRHSKSVGVSPPKSNKRYGGAMTRRDVELLLEMTEFALYYRLPSDGQPHQASIPLMVAYRTSLGDCRHYAIQQNHYSNGVEQQQMLFRVRNGETNSPTFSTLQSLIQFYEIYGHIIIHPNTTEAVYDRFPWWLDNQKDDDKSTPQNNSTFIENSDDSEYETITQCMSLNPPPLTPCATPNNKDDSE